MQSLIVLFLLNITEPHYYYYYLKVGYCALLHLIFYPGRQKKKSIVSIYSFTYQKARGKKLSIAKGILCMPFSASFDLCIFLQVHHVFHVLQHA